MELFLGNYIVDSLEGSSDTRLSPLQRPRGLLYRILPWLLVLLLCMLITRVLFPTGDWSSQAVQLFIVAALLMLCLSVIFNNGYQFVNSPRLKKDDWLEVISVVARDGSSSTSATKANSYFQSTSRGHYANDVIIVWCDARPWSIPPANCSANYVSSFVFYCSCCWNYTSCLRFSLCRSWVRLFWGGGVQEPFLLISQCSTPFLKKRKTIFSNGLSANWY